jgi:hypothetical protein
MIEFLVIKFADLMVFITNIKYKEKEVLITKR